jgi:hypothetical protein
LAIGIASDHGRSGFSPGRPFSLIVLFTRRPKKAHFREVLPGKRRIPVIRQSTGEGEHYGRPITEVCAEAGDAEADQSSEQRAEEEGCCYGKADPCEKEVVSGVNLAGPYWAFQMFDKGG